MIEEVSHRAEHARAARDLVDAVAAAYGRRPTGEEFRQVRRVVAATRRGRRAALAAALFKELYPRTRATRRRTT